MKRWHLFSLILLSLLLLPLWPVALWVGIQSAVDAVIDLVAGEHLPILTIGQRWFLMTLWLAGAVSVLLLLWLGIRERKLAYPAGAGIALVVFGLLSWAIMPLTPQQERRWEVEKQLRTGQWGQYLYAIQHQASTTLNDYDEGLPSVRENLRQLRQLARQKPVFAYLDEDVSAVLQSIGYPPGFSGQDGDAEAVRQLTGALKWMPDQAELIEAMLQYQFNLHTPEVADNVEWLSYQLLAADPGRSSAWLALALQRMFKRCWVDDCRYDAADLRAAQHLLAIHSVASEPQTTGDGLHVFLEQWIKALPAAQRAIHETLEARAALDVVQDRGEEVSAALQAKADRPLAVERIYRGQSRVPMEIGDSRFPGKVEVDHQQYGVINSQTLYPYIYPRVDRHIGEAVVMLVLDVTASGDVALVSLKQRSGVASFDEYARYLASTWLFEGTGTARRITIPVRFVSTLQAQE